MIIVIYGYNKQVAYNIIISISAGPTKEPWMKELKSMLDGRTCEVLPSHSFAFSQKTRITSPETHAHLRTKDGACVYIIFQQRRSYSCSVSWPHLVIMRLEYRILIYLLIVV